MDNKKRLVELLEKGRDLIGFSGVSSVAMVRLADDLFLRGVAVPVRCCECGFCDETMRCQCDNSCKGLVREDDDFCSYGVERPTEQ